MNIIQVMVIFAFMALAAANVWGAGNPRWVGVGMAGCAVAIAADTLARCL